jgi:hypothetical protein
MVYNKRNGLQNETDGYMVNTMPNLKHAINFAATIKVAGRGNVSNTMTCLSLIRNLICFISTHG